MQEDVHRYCANATPFDNEETEHRQIWVPERGPKTNPRQIPGDACTHLMGSWSIDLTSEPLQYLPECLRIQINVSFTYQICTDPDTCIRTPAAKLPSRASLHCYLRSNILLPESPVCLWITFLLPPFAGACSQLLTWKSV